MVDGEGEYAEHQVRHDFAGSADTNEARAELVFPAAVHALDHGAQAKALLLGGRERKPFSIVSGEGFTSFVIAP